MDSTAVLLFCFSLLFSICYGETEIEGIRLVGSSNNYAGNVQIRYNGTWGTICDSGWNLNDATVACRMLGFNSASCALSNAYYGRASRSVPIWISNLGCYGTEDYLDECPFYGWGYGNHYCTSHFDDAGVICQNDSLVGIPEVTAVNSSTRSITLSVVPNASQVSFFRQRYVVKYNSTSTSIQYYYSSYSYYSTPRNVTIILSNLIRDRLYSISVKHQVVVNSYCSYSFNYNGLYSNPIQYSTTNMVPPSKFGVRLISPVAGLDFLGRVEVFYQGAWGTVCDNYFDTVDAGVICNMLNFTGAICAVTNAGLGRGSGRIWLNRLTCDRSDEILDQCGYTTSISTYPGYYYYYRSSYYCRSNHYDDAGVVCRPKDPADFAPAPSGLTVNSSSANSVTFSWNRYSAPSYGRSWNLIIIYSRSDRPGRVNNAYVYSLYSTSYTVRYLTAGVTINATIRARGRFSNYNCYTNLYGAISESVEITTKEYPPSRPPRNFHISVVNCSAIHTEWLSPSFNEINGILRGYKLMYKTSSQEEAVIDLSANVTEYVIGGLAPSTLYEVSVLAYTVGDGPRSIFLSATTNTENICQTDVINYFGINANNDRDRFTVYSYSSLSVLCGSSLPNVKIDWFFSNGTKVGISNRNVREGHFANGTTVLQMGRFGRLTACDVDTFICRANQTTTGKAQQRTVTIMYNNIPSTPKRPAVINKTSTTVTITISQPDCDANHVVQSYTVRVGVYRYSYYYYYSRFSYVYYNDIDTRFNNFTVTNLDPLTTYYISVRARGREIYYYSSYSSSISVTTLAPVPSAPRAVSAELVAPNVLQVRWVRPPVLRGRLLYYTVYATPIASSLPPTVRSKRQAQSLQTVSKNFSSNSTSGDLTLPQLGVEYHIQIRATVLDSGVYRQSYLSLLTPNATIFVPIQGLPVPNNVAVRSSTNTSATLTWAAPSTSDTITGYIILYTATIEGKSPKGNLIRYTHSGNQTTTANELRATLHPLLPDTTYVFRVAVLTRRGEGMQVTVTGRTLAGQSEYEKYVYFHIRFGPVFSCQTFRRDIDGRTDLVKKQIYNFLKSSCKCSVTEDHITRGLFSCGSQPYQMIYRTQVMGTNDYSAADLVGLLQDWILTDQAYIVISPFKMNLDPTCPTRLDKLNDAECPVVSVDPHTGPPPIIYSTKPKPTAYSKPDSKANQGLQRTTANVEPRESHRAASASTVAGFFVGAIIIVLLLIIMVSILMIAVKCFKNKSAVRTRGGTDVFSDSNSAVRFNQFKNSDENKEELDDEILKDF